MPDRTRPDAPAYMEMALAEAGAAAARAEVPVGAVVVEPATGHILARQVHRVVEAEDVGSGKIGRCLLLVWSQRILGAVPLGALTRTPDLLGTGIDRIDDMFTHVIRM